MTFVRRIVLGFCSTLLLASLNSGTAWAQSAPASAPAAAVPTSSPQAYQLPPDKLAKAIAINRIRDILDIVASVWSVAVIWLFLSTRASASVESWAVRATGRRWLQGLFFFACLFVVLAMASLPIDVYGHHVSRAFGISIQGWGGWLGDQGKSLLLAVLIGSPVLLLFNWIVRRWPRRYWLAGWLVAVPIIVLTLLISPLFEPIFNKFEPLGENHAGLVAELEKVVARTGTDIPPSRMFLMKASAKTNGLNAYVNGIGATKRIVVWDTTAGRIPDDEVMFIFGHESGHFVLNHIPQQTALTVAGLFFAFWICSGLAAWLARRFGTQWGVQAQDSNAPPLASRTGFVVLILAVSTLAFLSRPISSSISRHYEHEADVYGQEAIHGLVPDPQKTAVAAFNALGEAWLEDPAPNPFLEFWLYDHPSEKNRAEFAADYNPWANGGHGRFFEQ